MSCAWPAPQDWCGVFFVECGGRDAIQGHSAIQVTEVMTTVVIAKALSTFCIPQNKPQERRGCSPCPVIQERRLKEDL